MFDNYTILENDSVDSISSKFNISSDLLKKINSNIDFKPGSVILVPKYNNNIFDYYVVKDGDTLYKISSDNNIDVSLLAQLNGVNNDDYIYANQILLIPRAGSILYITANGDTLLEVAKGINVNVMDLIKQNNNIYLQPEQLIVYKYK